MSNTDKLLDELITIVALKTECQVMLELINRCCLQLVDEGEIQKKLNHCGLETIRIRREIKQLNELQST